MVRMLFAVVFLSLTGTVSAAQHEYTNDILTIIAEDVTGCFTIKTGSLHPKPGENVFYGGTGSPATVNTSFITLCDYDAGILLVNTDRLLTSPDAGTGYPIDRMYSAGSVIYTSVAGGFAIAYFPSNFSVEQRVTVVGSSIQNSAVKHTVTIRNTSGVARTIGLRILWDWKILGIDATPFRTRDPDSAYTQVFSSFVNPAFPRYEETDSESLPTFSIYGTAAGGNLQVAPTDPGELRYASWNAAANNVWDFSNTGSLMDSGIVYYWGKGAPITLAPGEERSFTQYVTTNIYALMCAVPQLRKTVSPTSYVCGGEELVYTISWTNAGDATSIDLTITDTLAPGLRYQSPSYNAYVPIDANGQPTVVKSWAVSAAGPWTDTEPPDESVAPLYLRWVINRVAPGKSGWISYRTEVDKDIAWAAMMSNYVSATNALDDRSFYSNMVTSTSTRVLLSVVCGPAAMLNPGDSEIVELFYSSNCGDDVSNLVLRVPIPAGASYDPGSATGGGTLIGSTVTWNIGNLPAGTAGSVSYEQIVDGSKSPVVTAASADYKNQKGEDMPQVGASGQVDVTAPLLTFRKMVDPSLQLHPPARGDDFYYVLDIINLTPVAVTNISLWDTLSTDVTYVGSTDGGGLIGNCVVWPNIGSVPSGANRQVYLFVRAKTDVCEVGANTAFMGFTPDPGLPPSPRGFTYDSFSLAKPVLGLDREQVTDPVPEMGRVTIKYTVRNVGEDGAVDIVLVETIPAGFGFFSALPPPDTVVGSIYSWNIPPLAKNGTAVVDLTLDILTKGVNPAGPLEAWIDYKDDERACPDLSGGGGIMVNLAEPALELFREPETTAVAQGSTLQYIYTMTNTGTDTALNLVLWDTPPTGWAYSGCTSPPGGTCWQDGAMVVWKLPYLDTAAVTVFTASGVVIPAAGSLCSASAYAWCTNRVLVGTEIFKDVWQDCVTIGAVQVELKKRAQYDPVGRDSRETFALTLSPTGTVSIKNITVWDSLPTGALFVSCSGGTKCWFDGTKTVWTVAPMGPGTREDLFVTVTMTGSFSCSNYAETDYTDFSDQPMPRAMSNPSCVRVVQAVMSVTIIADSANYLPGQPVTYTIRYMNVGDGDANKVRMWDSLPAGAVFVSLTGPGQLMSGGKWVNWDLGSLPPGSQGELRLTVIPPAAACVSLVVPNQATAEFENTGSVRQPPATAPVLGPLNVTVSGITMALTLTPGKTVLRQGETVVYTLTWVNACSDTAWNVTIWNTLPPGLAYVSCAPPPGGSCGLSPSKTMVTWSPAGPVPPGSSGTASFTVQVTGDGPAIGPDTAWTGFKDSGGFWHANPSNQVWLSVLIPQLTASKTGRDESDTREPIAYTITVANRGTETAFDVVIVDTVPLPLRILSATGPSAPVVSGNVVSWRLVSLDIGATFQAVINTKAKDEDLDAVVVNTVTADCWTRPTGGVLRPTVSAAHTVMLTPVCIVRVFPNPYKPSSAARGTLKFGGLTEGATVRIYTMAGVEVARLSGVVRHKLEWNGRNKDGTPVAAGVYLYAIEVPDGSGGKRWVKGKFGLIR